VDGVVIHLPWALDPEEVARRAGRVALVLTDIDGVWTDGGVYYSDAGEALKRFSMRDGMGVARLRQAGIETGIVTGEQCQAVARRAEKLSLRWVFLGVADKQALLPEILRRVELRPEQLAYIGDDCNDLELIRELGREGLTAAPADAMPEVAAAVHFRSAVAGGHGAFRDFAEWILRARVEGHAGARPPAPVAVLDAPLERTGR
jgi:3-deoxy-D-manno-octulosonate 8-phosphate phosphatase (KDO 8-P phosphatase)